MKPYLRPTNERRTVLRVLTKGFPMLGVHLACLGAFWTGVTPRDLVLCGVLYALGMFGMTAGYHLYFAHGAFKTGRVMQVLLALLATLSAERGVLWWASVHRYHHAHADKTVDPHSPQNAGFLGSHVGWFLSTDFDATDPQIVEDLARYPELRLLERVWFLTPVLVGVGVALAFGWRGFFVGYCWSMVLRWHVSFAVGSLCHRFGSRRFDTPDASTNFWPIGVLGFGSGWHNNHHRYPSSARSGFAWWELDITFAILKLLGRLKIVWDVEDPLRPS